MRTKLLIATAVGVTMVMLSLTVPFIVLTSSAAVFLGAVITFIAERI